MANIASAKKRARQSEVRRQHKAGQRSMLKTFMKRVDAAIESKDKEAATSAYQAAIPVIDSAVSKGLIHKNKAARHKSRLNTRVHAL
ncbi:MAG: 30S ribosomal protein S20 [Gammaproteobacteria bacterium]|nr:MAG: 30S ribosomal protein S20 [Gammaproteobacteria bacterium]